MKPILLLLVFATAHAMAQEALTNDNVVGMVKAHLSETMLLDMVRRNPGKYVITPGALNSLKQQGVPDSVIAAMKAKMAGKPPARPVTPASASKPAPTPNRQAAEREPVPGEWMVRDIKDEITGESKFQAEMADYADSNGRRLGSFEVTAGCDSIALWFKITYLQDSGKNPGYKMDDGNWLLRRPHVMMRLSIDGHAGSAPSTTSDFINEATLRFQRSLTDDDSKDLGALVYGGLASLTSPAAPNDVWNAKVLKVELPLADGGLPILTIRPQSPDFQKFAARCKADDAERERRKNEEVAAREAQRREAADEEQLRQWGVDRKSFEQGNFGPPSMSDSFWTLNVKALITHNAELARYLSGEGSGWISLVFQVPGGPRSHIILPGDVVAGGLGWNSDQLQTVYVRSHNTMATRGSMVGQAEVDPRALAQLKQKRAALLALGVREQPAPDADAPAEPLPPSWTSRATWLICPPQTFFHTDGNAPRREIAIRTPTEVAIVSHKDGLYQVRLLNSAEQPLSLSPDHLAESCPGFRSLSEGAAPAVSADSRPSSAGNGPAIQTGQFVCPGTIIVEPGKPHLKRVIETPVEIVEVNANRPGWFKLAHDSKTYLIASGAQPQSVCRR